MVGNPLKFIHSHASISLTHNIATIHHAYRDYISCFPFFIYCLTPKEADRSIYVATPRLALRPNGRYRSSTNHLRPHGRCRIQTTTFCSDFRHRGIKCQTFLHNPTILQASHLITLATLRPRSLNNDSVILKCPLLLHLKSLVQAQTFKRLVSLPILHHRKIL